MKELIKNIQFLMLCIFSMSIVLTSCGGDDDVAIAEVEARFTADITDSTGVATFLNLSSNADTYAWEFGDGSTSSEINPVHRYIEEGTYTVKLTASNATGSSDTFEDVLVIIISGGNTGGGDEPETAAPDPTRDAANVISLFSDVYTDVPVDTWRTDWSNAVFEDVLIDGNPTKKYSNLDFVGIETVANTVNASGMTHIHFDVWSADFTALGVKLVDFGADGVFDGGDDSEFQIDYDMTTQGSWVGYDIPLSDFTGLSSRDHLAQYILVAQPSGMANIYVDNIYFYSGGTTGGSDPTVAAPDPTRPAADVISLFSDVYTDVPVDTWRTDWSSADFEDVMVAGNPTKKYSNLDFVGIETVMNQIDASGMTHIHMDVWSADYTFLGVKLVDFGADGAFGGGDDTEHQVDDAAPTQGEWVSYDIPFTDFINLMSTNNLAQYILVGQPTGETTVYFDNIYLYNDSGTGGGDEPTTAAPDPTLNEADVISLFSDVYTDVPVDTWRTDWSSADFEDVMVAGNATKKYSNLDFVGIETVMNQINASGMTHIHMDIWSADYSFLGLKIVDFGSDGAFGGGDDTEHQVNDEMTTQGEWVSYDIPLSDFTGLMAQGNLAQYILSAQPTGMATAYLDNLYLYNDGAGGATEPTESAPAPTRNEADVISLFSDVYTDVPVDIWRTDWSSADFEDVMVAGNATKKYSNLDFVGIETVMNQVNASGMTHIHMDIWSADFTFLGIKIVDFGADGAFGGGDDTEHQVNDEMTTQGEWVSYDIPLSDFTGLMSQGNLAQYILSAQPVGMNTVFLDNLYFYNDGTGGATEPTESAPTPTRNEADVISLFSDAYTDVPVETWRTDWSSADFEDVMVAGNATKKYSNLDFVGIETVMNQVNATGMSHIHMDIWSADFTFLGIKIVDFGADGAFGGGDDTEHQVNDEMTTQGEWVSYDIPLSDFTGLMAQGNLAQYILSAQPVGGNTIYLDNFYFYNDGTGGANEPTEAAPAPTLDASNVISLFSDVYSDVNVDTWRTDWSSATFEDVMVAGNATKKYSDLDFVGIETTSSTVDATSMTHVHLDVWSADFTVFSIKIVDFGADGAFGGGDDVEHQVNYDMPNTGEWVAYDIPLSDFTGLTTRANLAQYILVGQPSGATTVYVDNFYFHN